MKQEQLDKAMLEPATIFPTPEDVLREESLTTEQKVEILSRWEYQAADEAVALEEGMPGDDSDLLYRILTAIGEVAGRLDLERTAPSKQHGLGDSVFRKLTE